MMRVCQFVAVLLILLVGVACRRPLSGAAVGTISSVGSAQTGWIVSAYEEYADGSVGDRLGGGAAEPGGTFRFSMAPTSSPRVLIIAVGSAGELSLAHHDSGAVDGLTLSRAPDRSVRLVPATRYPAPMTVRLSSDSVHGDVIDCDDREITVVSGTPYVTDLLVQIPVEGLTVHGLATTEYRVSPVHVGSYVVEPGLARAATVSIPSDAVEVPLDVRGVRLDVMVAGESGAFVGVWSGDGVSQLRTDSSGSVHLLLAGDTYFRYGVRSESGAHAIDALLTGSPAVELARRITVQLHAPESPTFALSVRDQTGNPVSAVRVRVEELDATILSYSPSGAHTFVRALPQIGQLRVFPLGPRGTIPPYLVGAVVDATSVSSGAPLEVRLQRGGRLEIDCGSVDVTEFDAAPELIRDGREVDVVWESRGHSSGWRPYVRSLRGIERLAATEGLDPGVYEFRVRWRGRELQASTTIRLDEITCISLDVLAR